MSQDSNISWNSSEKADIIEKEVELCSKYITLNEKTLPNSGRDSINSNDILVNASHPHEVLIYWTPPDRPNGVVLYYQLRYRKTYSDTSPNTAWSSACVSQSDWLNEGRELMKFLNLNQSSEISLDRINWRFETGSGKSSVKRVVQAVADGSKHIGGTRLIGLMPGEYEFEVMLVSLAGNGSWSNRLTFTVQEKPDQTYIIWIVVLVLLLLATIVGILVGFILHRKKQRYLKQHTWVSPNPEYSSVHELDDWELDCADINMFNWSQSLGKGSFGVVYKGVLTQLTTPAKQYFKQSANIEVAVKTISRDCSMYDRREFLNEACYMKQFQGYHLVHLLGVVVKFQPGNRGSKSRFRFLKRKWILKHLPNRIAASLKETEEVNFINERFTGMPIVVMEFMANGDLASYLRRVGDEGDGMISKEQALLWAAHIADGMLYLSSMKYVHRDLAARNCMIDHNLIVKIGDFGFARDICDNNYYRKQGGGRMPIRWMAPESIRQAYFSTKSDVWAYGVVLWEMITLASLPYRGMSHEEVMDYVTAGNTLISNGFPTKCPEVIGYLMVHCWNYKDEDRPTFYQILTLLNNYIDENFRKNSFFYNIDEWLKSKKLRENDPLSDENYEEGGTITTDIYTDMGNSNNKSHSPDGLEDSYSPNTDFQETTPQFSLTNILHDKNETNSQSSPLHHTTTNKITESFAMKDLCKVSDSNFRRVKKPCVTPLLSRDRSHKEESETKHLLVQSLEDTVNNNDDTC